MTQIMVPQQYYRSARMWRDIHDPPPASLDLSLVSLVAIVHAEFVAVAFC